MRAGQVRLRVGGPKHPTRQLTSPSGRDPLRYIGLEELAQVRALIATLRGALGYRQTSSPS